MKMSSAQRRRLAVAILIIVGVGTAVALTLTAFRQNLMFYYTPSEVVAGKAPANRAFRVGGLVVEGSVSRSNNGLTVHFALTDTDHTVKVRYTGILPDLFREGQGIVAQGTLNAAGVLVADRVLAKHDENYMPPAVHDALQAARADEKTGT